MDVLATCIRPDGLIVELEQRASGRLGVALFDTAAQDWRRVWPDQPALLARLLFWIVAKMGGFR